MNRHDHQKLFSPARNRPFAIPQLGDIPGDLMREYYTRRASKEPKLTPRPL